MEGQDWKNTFSDSATFDLVWDYHHLQHQGPTRNRATIREARTLLLDCHLLPSLMSKHSKWPSIRCHIQKDTQTFCEDVMLTDGNERRLHLGFILIPVNILLMIIF